MRQLRELVRTLRRHLRGPTALSLATCLILPKSRLVYAFIPKAACTSIKSWLLRYSGECPEVAEQYAAAERNGTKPPDAHRAMYDRFNPRNYSALEIQRALIDPAYFKFTFVRHPLRRLVSSYLDKIVNAREIAHPLIAAGQLAQGCSQASLGSWWRAPRIDAERSLSFREFVGAFAAADQEALEIHFRPQHRLLRGLEFDFIGKIENLPRDFEVVQKRLQISTPLTWKHQKDYTVPVTGCVADWPAARFRNVAVPPWQSFFDDELRRTADTLLADDFQRFGYAPARASLMAA